MSQVNTIALLYAEATFATQNNLQSRFSRDFHLLLRQALHSSSG